MRHCNSILIAEDDNDIRNALAEALNTEGYTNLTIATNGREAVELIPKLQAPVLLFLDLLMPVMDGYSVLEEVSRNGWEHLIKVVIITASAGRNLAQRLPPDIEIIKKPFDFQDFLDVVHKNRGPPPYQNLFG